MRETELTPSYSGNFSAWKPRLSEAIIEEMTLSTPDNRYYGKLFQRMERTLNRRSFVQLIDQGIIQFVDQSLPTDEHRQFGEPKPVEFVPEAVPGLLETIDMRIKRLQAVKNSLLIHQSVLRSSIEA